MQTEWTLQDARNNFNKVIGAAALGTPQFVTQNEGPSVVIISSSQYKKNMDSESITFKPGFVDLLLSMPQESETDASFDEARRQLQLREVDF